jgi:hypothetical protein
MPGFILDPYLFISLVTFSALIACAHGYASDV